MIFPLCLPAALWLAAAVEVHTAREVVAVNGTNQRLKCSFSSSSPVGQQLAVSWNFQPEDLGSHELVSEILCSVWVPPVSGHGHTPNPQVHLGFGHL